MVKIRLARGGAKQKPFYSIVVTDSRKRRDSAYIERLGHFNPVARGQEARLFLEEDRLAYWRSKGAQLSDRVKQLVKEFKDPSIREKALAKQAAIVEVKAKSLANEAMKEAQAQVKAEKASAKVAAQTEEVPVEATTEQVVEATSAKAEKATE